MINRRRSLQSSSALTLAGSVLGAAEPTPKRRFAMELSCGMIGVQ
jgi:hypothetical protein